MKEFFARENDLKQKLTRIFNSEFQPDEIDSEKNVQVLSIVSVKWFYSNQNEIRIFFHIEKLFQGIYGIIEYFSDAWKTCIGRVGKKNMDMTRILVREIKNKNILSQNFGIISLSRTSFWWGFFYRNKSANLTWTRWEKAYTSNNEIRIKEEFEIKFIFVDEWIVCTNI